MRKMMMLLLSLLLVAAALTAPATAGKKKKKSPPAPVRVERVQEQAYENPSMVILGAGYCNPSLGGCYVISRGLDEKYVKLEIEDAAGLTPVAYWWMDTDGDGVVDDSLTFCGGSDGFFEAPDAATTYLAISPGPSADPQCAGGATQGTITLTYSNLP